jgi:DNA-binding transcriptional ArsR family regulator
VGVSRFARDACLKVELMGKIYETKRKILGILYKKHSTLTEMSDILELAPSTVSRHLKELRADGVIELVDNPYIKKWKYYAIAPEELVSDPISGRRLQYPYIRNRIL